MKKKNIDQINSLNQRFYKAHALSFNRTRRINWKGWDEFWPIIEKQLEKIEQGENYEILDVGCGNGRFFDYLSRQSKNEFKYAGIDSSEELLDIAKKKYTKDQTAAFSFLDLIQDPELKTIYDEYNLVVAFGLMHHIPRYDLRMQMLKSFAGKLKDDGVLIFTLWQFMKSERMQKHVVQFEKVASIEKTELEKNDYFLDWDNTGIPRFCHNFTDEEVEKIKESLTGSGLKLIKEYSADGKEGDLNRYLVFSK